MKKFAVAYGSFNNNIKIEIIEANAWKEALYKHTLLQKEWDGILELSDNFEEAKLDAIGADCMFDVVEL